MLRRILSVLLCAALLCALCPGCARERKKLRVCFDIGDLLDTDYAEAGGSRQKAAAESFLRYLDDCAVLTGGITSEEVELELIPSGREQAAERQAALQRVRTELLSGGGPDVFVCLSGEAGELFGPPEGGRLFPYVEKTMQEDFFLPLDDYIRRAVLMQWDKFFPTVMDGGKDDKGRQVILPMTFSIAAALYDREDLPEYDSAGKTWEDVLAGDDPILADQVRIPWVGHLQLFCGDALHVTHISRFSSLFPRLADPAAGELCFTEEELFRQVKAVVEGGKALSRAEPAPYHRNALLGDHDDLEGEAEKNRDFTLVPMRNLTGGTTARVRMWCAVNRNTERPGDAFAAVDALMSESLQKSGELYHAAPGRTVNRELDVRYGAPDILQTRPETRKSWLAACGQIDAVRFSSPLDDTLTEMMNAVEAALLESIGTEAQYELLNAYSQAMKGSVSEEALRDIVHEYYRQLQRQLGEM